MSRIVRFEAENYARLVAVDITPDEDMVILSGRNHQGKTSILNAIFHVLQGRKVKEVSQAIRDGQDVAYVKLWIGDDIDHVQYIATRRWTKDDAGTLTVEAADGAKYSSPQRLLDEIVGELSFDPMRFLELSAKDQVDALVDVLGPALPFDPKQLAAERLGVYDRRTAVGHEVKKVEGLIASLPDIDPSLPAEEVSAADLIREAEMIQERNAGVRELHAALDRAAEEVQRADDIVLKAKEALKYAELKAVQAREDFVHAQLAAAPVSEVDVSPVLERLNDIEAMNRRIRQQQERLRAERHLADQKEQVARLTLALDEIDARKAQGIAEAKFPVEGLSFGDDGVTFNGIPFSQASTEEQIRASFGIAIAANPNLRVSRIDRGESLDADSLKILADLAREHGVQVWLTKVTDGRGVGFVVEEGTVTDVRQEVAA
jgi:hypothetical protein